MPSASAAASTSLGTRLKVPLVASVAQPASSTKGLSLDGSWTVCKLRWARPRGMEAAREVSSRRSEGGNSSGTRGAVARAGAVLAREALGGARRNRARAHILASSGRASAQVFSVSLSFWISVRALRAPLPTAVPQYRCGIRQSERASRKEGALAMGRGVSRCQRLSEPAHRWYASPHTLALHPGAARKNVRQVGTR